MSPRSSPCIRPAAAQSDCREVRRKAGCRVGAPRPPARRQARRRQTESVRRNQTAEGDEVQGRAARHRDRVGPGRCCAEPVPRPGALGRRLRYAAGRVLRLDGRPDRLPAPHRACRSAAGDCQRPRAVPGASEDAGVGAHYPVAHGRRGRARGSSRRVSATRGWLRVRHRRRAPDQAYGVRGHLASRRQDRRGTGRDRVPRAAALLRQSAVGMASRSRLYRHGSVMPRRPRRSTPTPTYGRTATTGPARRSTLSFLRTTCGLGRSSMDATPSQEPIGGRVGR